MLCSNPDCRGQTVAPSESDEETFTYLGKAAHISAAAAGGPRYDSKMSPQERSSISNAIFLCSSCADLIDKNEGKDFPVTVLRQWKVDHEQWVTSNLNKRHGGIGGEGGGGTIIGNRGAVVGARFPEEVPYIDAGVDLVPTDWINQRLLECGESWRVEVGEAGYSLPPLD